MLCSGVPPKSLRVEVRAQVGQRCDDGRVPVERGRRVERRGPAVVARVQIRAGRDEHDDDGGIPADRRRDVQRRPAVVVPGFEVRARVDQGLDDVRVPVEPRPGMQRGILDRFRASRFAPASARAVIMAAFALNRAAMCSGVNRCGFWTPRSDPASISAMATAGFSLPAAVA